MKKRFLRIISMVLVCLLSVSLLAGCSNAVDGTKDALTVNGEKISVGTANFILRYQQAIMNSQLPLFGLDETYWDMEVSENEKYSETFKNNIKDVIVELMVVRQHASEGEYEVSLSEDDEASIATAAQGFMDANADTAKQMGVTIDNVKEALELYTIESKFRTEFLNAQVFDRDSLREEAQAAIDEEKAAEEEAAAEEDAAEEDAEAAEEEEEDPETVLEARIDSLIEEKKTEAYNDILDTWREEADVVEEEGWKNLEVSKYEFYTVEETTDESTVETSADSTVETSVDSTVGSSVETVSAS